jgi:flagellar motor component MotA
MILAAQITTMDKLKAIPPQFWLMLAAVIGGIMVITLIIRHLVRANKIMLTIGSCLVMVLVAFNWVYKRNEPKFLTPLVDKVAPFFPSQGDYAGKQANQTVH